MAIHTWSTGEEILASHLNDSFTAKQNALTFGIADTNSLVVDGSPNDNEFARFTASGLEGRTYAEVLASLSGQAGADFSMNSNKITNVTDPTSDQDAATKKYVDDEIEGGLEQCINPLVGISDYKWWTDYQLWAWDNVGDDASGFFESNINTSSWHGGGLFKIDTGSAQSYAMHRINVVGQQDPNISYMDRIIMRIRARMCETPDQEISIGFVSTVSDIYSPITDTSYQVRFVATGSDNDDKLYAMAANGTTAESTEITGVTYKNTWVDYVIDFDVSGGEAKFYCDGALKVTLNTNVPASGSPHFGVGIKDINDSLYISPMILSYKIT